MKPTTGGLASGACPQPALSCRVSGTERWWEAPRRLASLSTDGRVDDGLGRTIHFKGQATGMADRRHPAPQATVSDRSPTRWAEPDGWDRRGGTNEQGKRFHETAGQIVPGAGLEPARPFGPRGLSSTKAVQQLRTRLKSQLPPGTSDRSLRPRPGETGTDRQIPCAFRARHGGPPCQGG